MSREDALALLADPLALPLIVLCGLVIAITLLLVAVIRSGRSARLSQSLAADMVRLGAGQSRLAGNLQTVSDSQAAAQMSLITTVETRLSDVQARMNERLADNAAKSARALADMQARLHDQLHGQGQRTTTTLTQLRERLSVIDRAQDNITKLSGDVLGLQDILSNKQRRGLFGEIQLSDIVTRALPPDGYTMQATLSNGRRADCLVHLPDPPGPIAVDAKFPFEAFEALAAAEGRDETARALRALGQAVRKHIRDIADRYIIEGETADGAIMFLPSEAVYAELHARLPEVVREGFAARVWIVSPTTCMATLNTMRAILRDARMREQAGAIRRELGLLHADCERLVARVGQLDRHFDQARKDLDDIRISGERAGKRAGRLHGFDFDPGAAETDAPERDGAPAEG